MSESDQDLKLAWRRLRRAFRTFLCEYLIYHALRLAPQGYVPSLIKHADELYVRGYRDGCDAVAEGIRRRLT